ncbi:TRAP transporter small permease subunit [Marinobacteraceae bacterium S3BR75-40.1]
MDPATHSSSPLDGLITKLERFTEYSGRLLAWLNVAMVALTMFIVVSRYLFNVSWIAMEESVLYLHSAVFMLASAYTLKHNGHVRVDIFYQRMTPRSQGWVDLAGTLFLLFPVIIFLFWQSWPYAAASWAIREHSPESSGLPAVFLLKSLIPLMCVLIAIQGLAEALRGLLRTRGATPPERGVIDREEV